MKVSREGVVLIKSFEGFRAQATRDADDRWVIGYGHRQTAREGVRVGEADAELLLQYDLLPIVRALNAAMDKGRIPPLNSHQFDALASFAMSVGLDRFLASDVLDTLARGQPGETADALVRWPQPATPEDGLRRRAAERALFMADPARPVALSELLAAPLPPPASLAASSGPDSRAEAVAALLGEPPITDTASMDGSGGEEATAVVIPSFGTAIVADLAEDSGPEGSELAETMAIGAEPMSPVAESSATGLSVERLSLAMEDPPRIATAVPEQQHYAPYQAQYLPPLHGRSHNAAFLPAQSALSANGGTQPPVTDTAAPAVEAPAVPQTEPEPQASQTLPAEHDHTQVPALELTPPIEIAPDPSERTAWDEAQRTPAFHLDQTPLFLDGESTPGVLMHEQAEIPARRFDWRETGAFMIMGGVGLAACTASAAAFRLAVDKPSPMGETTIIAWVLALIGAICVIVSAWSLYVRTGRKSASEPQAE